MNEAMQAHFDKLRAKRQAATQAMKRRSKSVKHVPQHMKEMQPRKALRGIKKKSYRPAIPFIQLPKMTYTEKAFKTMSNKVVRFYGWNNKYLGNGQLRNA